jgi:hypothetical protein
MWLGGREGFGLRVVGARSKWREGKRCHGAPGLGARAGLVMWPTPNGRHRAHRITGRGKRGFSHRGITWSGSRVRARARRACRLGGPVVPSVCARAAATWVGAALRCGEGKGGEEERSEADERVPRVSEGKEKDEGSDGLGCGARRPAGLVGLVGLVSRLRRLPAQVRS